MEQSQVLVAVAAFVTALVGAIKKAFPKWADGKEELLSLVGPTVILPVLKLAHALDLSWANVAVMVLVIGAGSGVMYDKLVKPFMGGKSVTP